jgi:hypothetical protein
MYKYQMKEVAKLEVAHKLGMSDYVARGLSALIRAAWCPGARAGLMVYAEEWGVRNHPEFIV